MPVRKPEECELLFVEALKRREIESVAGSPPR